MEVLLTYPCSICNDIFASKSARDNHIRRICQSFITLTDLNGTIIRIERTNGIFQCLTRIGPGIDMSIPRFKVGDGSASGGATTDFDVSIPTLKIENDMSIP